MLILSVQINALLPKHLLMQPFNTFKGRHGQIVLYLNEKGRLLLAQASGYISPQLLRKELNFLQQFAAQQTRPWKYMVDLTEVRFAHPFNPFFCAALNGCINSTPILPIRQVVCCVLR